MILAVLMHDYTLLWTLFIILLCDASLMIMNVLC